MHSDITDPSATSPASDLLESILNTSLNGIIAYASVRDRSGTIIDFRAITITRVAQQMLHLPDTEPGWRLLALFPTALTNGTFARYVRVVDTGKPGRFEISGDTCYDVSAVKLNDGFVATFIDITSEKQASAAINEQNKLLNSILNTSLSSVLLYETVRDETGQIQDFQLMMTSPRAEAEIKHHFSETAHNRTLLTINPESRRMGQFDRYVDVVETGQGIRREHFYANINAWYDTTITPSGNGVVITATNITAQKQAQQELEQQADLLQNILTGILLLEPIYQDDGTVMDFRILSANRAAGTLTNTDSDTIVGQTMLAVFPTYKNLGFFDLYRDVLEIGQPRRREILYEDDKRNDWFEVLVVKQGNNVGLTYTKTTDSRLAQQRLQQAANDLQGVIDQSQTGIFVFSPVYDDRGIHVDFRFKTINRMVAALIGQTPDVLIGQVASDWFTSYRETGLFDRYKQTQLTGEEQRFDINYTVDGFDVWFDVHSVRFGNDVLVTFTNYSDLKRAQLAAEKLALETSKTASMLDSVLNGSINGIMSFEAIRDEAGTITDFRFKTINEASERIVGVSAETMLEKETLLTIFPGNVESGLFAKYVHTAQTGEPTRTEVYYQADGLDFWLDVSAQKLGDGFVVTFTDTTLLKRASQAIEQSAAELQTVIDMSQTGIFLFSPEFDESGELVDFRYRIANKTVAAFAGQDSATASGTLASNWFPDYKQNGLFDRYKALCLSGGQTQFDFHYEGDGVDAWVNIVATRINHEILVTFSDFTELKKLQQQLEASVIDLQRSNKNLEQFAYVASHDLQEPLRKIQQFGDILQTSYAPVLDDSGQDMLGRMQSAAERMRVLIKDVLAYSRIATKRENEKAIDLNKVVREVTGDLERAIAEKNALVRIDTLPTITGDAIQLRQLFQNLISNSLKFTKPGGQPELQLRYTVQRGRDTGLPVSASDNATQFYRFELSDNGIGFDSHQAEKIFQVFQRLHNRNEYQGTGIGLAIVQKVIENHQGYIRAEGRPGEGATFTVLLPV